MRNECFRCLEEKGYGHYSEGFLRLAKAVIIAESGGDPKAVSPKGAVGCMQLMRIGAKDVWEAALDYWSEEFWGFEDFWEAVKDDPCVNVEAGLLLLRLNLGRILRALIKRGWDIEEKDLLLLTAASYNAGIGKVLKAIQEIDNPNHIIGKVLGRVGHKETWDYVNKIEKLMEKL